MTTGLSVKGVLGREGVLSRRLEGFRERPSQLAMAEAVEAAFATEEHLLVEAPTGTGKSLAYLVPALLGPIQAGQRVVISTHTIALQDQLLEKDLPLLAASLPVEFTAVKGVGRGNHLGLRRMLLAQSRAPTLIADDPETQALRRLLAWSRDTEEGLRQELDPPVPPSLWEEVQSESDNCLGRRCPQFQDCFWQKARRRLETADLIVTNHALYVVDLLLRRHDRALLPDHDVVILDEAHHFESVAMDHLGIEVSERMVSRFLSRLRTRGRRQGLLDRVGGPKAVSAGESADGVLAIAQTFFDEVRAFREERPQGNGRVQDPFFVEDSLGGPLLELSRELEDVAEMANTPELAVEVQAVARRAEALGRAVHDVLSLEDPDLVHWTEEEPRGGRVRLVARPLDVAETLREDLFGRIGSAVLTSATLAVGPGEEGLRWPARRLGVGPSNKRVLPSPFDLERQVQAFMVRGGPMPDEARFVGVAAGVLADKVLAAKGGAFLLFTSYRALEAFWRQMRGPLSRAGLHLLKQEPGGDRAGLVRRFRKDGNAVLFGTESFWEGVDVPGAALRLVAITRLPFPVPTTPLNEARAERLRAEGRDAFQEWSLPEAVLKFRQGFGRLIRTEEDEGVFLCVDPRLSSRSYGRKFRDALGALGWEVLTIPAS